MAAPDLIVTPFADQGTKNTPPQTDPNSFVNFRDGYTNNYEISLASGNPQAKAVERPIQNYLFNQMTLLGQAWQQMGIPPWYAGMPNGYAQNAQVLRVDGNGIFQPYRSLVSGNVTDPANTPAQWEYIKRSSEVLASVPMPGGGALGASAELVTVAIDFNNAQFSGGTFEFATNAVAAGSSNSPAGRAGMLECKSWTVAGTTYTLQRYLTNDGNVFTRSASGGAWTAWKRLVDITLDQSGTNTFATDTGAVNAYVGNPVPALVARTEGMTLRLKVANTNTGASTFNDGLGALPLLGLGHVALTAGQVIGGGYSWLQYSTTAGPGTTPAWVVCFATGGPGLYVPLSGGTMTGDLGLQYAAGNQRGVQWKVGNNNRWYVYEDGTAESGANAGSNFAIGRYSDAGAAIDNPITINRATGVVGLSQRPVWATFTPWDNSNLPSPFQTTGGTVTGATTFSGAITFNTTVTMNATNILKFNAVNGGTYTGQMRADGATQSVGFINQAGTGFTFRVSDAGSIFVQGGGSFGTRPTFGSFIPWDNGNLPSPIQTTGGAFSGQVDHNANIRMLNGTQIQLWKAGNSAFGSIQYVADPGISAIGILNQAQNSWNMQLNDAGVMSLPRARPTWAGLTPWDNGNFNPAAYQPVGNYTVNGGSNNTQGMRFVSGAPPGFGSASFGQSALQIANGGNNSASACMVFIRDGAFGAFFGLDADNQLKYGGGSTGVYRVWHEGNLNPATAGAQVQWGSAISELAGVVTGADVTQDAGGPWVVEGLRTNGGNNRIFMRVVWLRNQ